MENLYCPNHHQHLKEDGASYMDIYGYKHAPFRSFLLLFLGFISFGSVFLIFHWKPHWKLICFKNRCSLMEASLVLIKTECGNISVAPVVQESFSSELISDADDKFREQYFSSNILPDASCTERTIICVDKNYYFRFFMDRHLKYVWDVAQSSFQRLRGLDDGIESCGRMYSRFSDGLSSNQYEYRSKLYGNNVIDIKVPSILSTLINQTLHPFYIFQILSIILWSCDNYVFYASCIFLILTISMLVELYETQRQMKTLRDMVKTNQESVVKFQGGAEVEDVFELLVPGDLIVMPAEGCLMTCDALLLTGEAIVNESLLTGESVPITKTALDPSTASNIFSAEAHKRHILYSGTQVIRARTYREAQVRAVVIRTGFLTAKGELIRSILYPKPIGFKFYEDSLKFVGVLFLLSVVGMIYTGVTFGFAKSPISKIVLRTLDVITIVIPPALPAAMTIGSVYSQQRLKRSGIFCINPSRINVSGKTKLVVFDKTGTLTEDGLDLWAVLPVKSGAVCEVVTDMREVATDDLLVVCMATCHSLARISGEVKGDPLDLKMFEATEWILDSEGGSGRFDSLIPTVVRPGANFMTQGNELLEVGIVCQFPFSSNAQCMSVVSRRPDQSFMQVFVKGAPEKIISLCTPESVPPNVHHHLQTYTQRGFRVIALACKLLDVSWHQCQRLPRDRVECDLVLLGFLIMENKLKPTTTPVVGKLLAAGIRVVMATGDNIQTAVSVARQCGIVEPLELVVQAKVLPPHEGHQTASLEWMPFEGKIVTSDGQQSDGDVASEEIYQDFSKFRIVMTGRTFFLMKQHFPELFQKICVRGVVFARMSSDQKCQLVLALQDLGYTTCMCGDGANDCSSLKAAHVGISLSDAEASVASPFTSKVANIECVPKVISEGRSALVTSFGVFKFMALYSIIQFVSVMILYSVLTNLSDWMFLFIDLIIITPLAFLMGKTGPSSRLSRSRPPGSLMSFNNILALAVHVVFVVACQCGVYFLLLQQDWFTPVVRSAVQDVVQCWETTTVFLTSIFQYLMLSICFSTGWPHRMPIYTNVPFCIVLFVLMAFSILLVVHPLDFIVSLVQMKVFPPTGSRFPFFILAFVAAHFLLAFSFEKFVVSKFLLKKMWRRCIRKSRWKNRYHLLQGESGADWPPPPPMVTHEFIGVN